MPLDLLAVADEEAPPARQFQCDHCGRQFEGDPGGAGLLLWTRGEEVRFEEPPLCEQCASSITIGALMKWESEEEDEG
jgi:NAD-dependent SIR2 family protein deacetylase